jgi:hypothetical protein
MTQLNPGYVFEPFHNLISACQTNVVLGLRLVEEIETFPGPTGEEVTAFQLRFQDTVADLNESKAQFKRWIIWKGLGDIHQCIGRTLQRLIVFRTIDSELRIDSALDIEARERVLSQGLRGLSYPDLIGRANGLCSGPLIMEAQIATFNNARNCVEHSGGIVTKRFCNTPHKDKLIIQGRRVKLFFKRGDEETPAKIGTPGPENAALMMGLKTLKSNSLLASPWSCRWPISLTS